MDFKPKKKLRSLENYKLQHAETAKRKGVYEMFMSAPTLTRARAILFGTKKGMKRVLGSL